MTDRELLEAAARAAGIVMDSQTDTWYQTGGGWCRAEWNPLTDDGDALRLAVKLQMRVSSGQVDWVGAEYVGMFATPEECEADICAATRRVIVRAAAAIGKEMP